MIGRIKEEIEKDYYIIDELHVSQDEDCAVWRVKDKKDTQIYVLKAKVREDREAEILKELVHENIVKFIEVFKLKIELEERRGDDIKVITL